MSVSFDRVAAMAVSLLLAVGLPIFLLFFWRKRTKAKFSAALVGALIFVVFVYGLENALHQLCIYQDTGLSRFIVNTPWAYVLYAGFAAGIFEETGRLVAFRLLLRKQNERKTSVMYGIGHGGIESILVAGFPVVMNLVYALWINAAGEAAVIAGSGEAATAAMTAAVASLKTTPAAMFLVSGIERVTAICLHISLSVLVFLAVKRKGKSWLYPVAILIHAAVDCYAVLYHVGVIPNIVWIEIGVAVMTALTAFWAYRLYKADTAPEVPAETPCAEAPAENT